MLVPYALRSPIAIDKAAEKQFPFFPLVSLARSKTTIPSSTVSIAKKPTIFQFSLPPPPSFFLGSARKREKTSTRSPSLFRPSMQRNFPRAYTDPSIFFVTYLGSYRKKTYCLSRERRKYRLLRGISLITDDKKIDQVTSSTLSKTDRSKSSHVHDRVRKRASKRSSRGGDLGARIGENCGESSEQEGDGASPKDTRIDSSRADASRGHRWGMSSSSHRREVRRCQNKRHYRDLSRFP